MSSKRLMESATQEISGRVEVTPMEEDRVSIDKTHEDETGAPPRRRRRSQRSSLTSDLTSLKERPEDPHRMSVSDVGESGNIGGAEDASSKVARNLESDGDGHTDEEIDEDIIDEDYDSVSEADPLDYDTYYSFNEDLDDMGVDRGQGGEGSSGNVFNNNDDPEFFAYECLTVERAEKTLQDQINIVCNATNVSVHFAFQVSQKG